MKEYHVANIRNIAILGHLGTGKTSFSESLLFKAKVIDKKGEVERKTTVSDYTAEEQARLTTLVSSLLPLEWKDCKINFIDTPGSEEFVGDFENVLSVVEGCIILVDANKGIEVGTERVYRECKNRNLPVLFFINKMDKENVKLDEIIADIQTKLTSKVVICAQEWGTTNNFLGYINVLEQKAVSVAGDVVEVPSDCVSKLEEAYASLTEHAAEANEELMNKYFETMELSKEEISEGLKVGISNADLYPLLIGSGIKNVCIDTVLDMIVDFFPAPNLTEGKLGVRNGKEELRAFKEDDLFSSYVFKTSIDPFQGTINYLKVVSGSVKAGYEVFVSSTQSVTKIPILFTMLGKTQIPVEVCYAGDIVCCAKLVDVVNQTTITDKKDNFVFNPVVHPTPIIYVAIQPKNKQDEDKISASLQKLKIEDETLDIVRNPETAQQLIGGQGMTHLNYILEKMKNMFKVEVITSDQRVVYRETITAKGEAQGKHKKQSGGAGQYGDVWIRFEPCEEKFVFTEEVVGGAVPKNYFPAVEKGLIETLERGPLAGFPVIGVKATLYFGSYHDVDSNELSFKLAARLAFQNACSKIKPTILEPIYQVNIYIKDEYVGAVMGELSKRRGRVVGNNSADGLQEIIAEVPEAEITKYAIDLKAMTQASGRFSRKFLRYEQVPEMLIKNICEEAKKYNEK